MACGVWGQSVSQTGCALLIAPLFKGIGLARAVAPGAAYSYSFSVTNNGPSDAQNVLVTDDLPAGVEHVSGGGAFLPLFYIVLAMFGMGRRRLKERLT